MEGNRCPLCHSEIGEKETAKLSVSRSMVDTLEPVEVAVTAAGLAASAVGAEFFVRFLSAMAGAGPSTSGAQHAIVLLVVAWIGVASADRTWKVRQWWQPAVLGGVMAIVFSVILRLSFGIAIARALSAAYPISLLVFASAFGFSFVFRKTYPALRFAWFHHVLENVEVEGRKGRYDTALCGTCGERTPISSLRPMAVFYRRRYRYFCKSCGAFLRGNPVKSLAYGVFEVATVWLFLSLAIVGQPMPSGVPANLLLAALVLLMTLDGAMRAWHGLAGVGRLFLPKQEREFAGN